MSILDAFSFNKYVDEFETLNYRPVLSRKKRGVNFELEPVFLKFRSHKRLSLIANHFRKHILGLSI